MAQSAVIGALRFVLGADTAAFEKSLNAAARKMADVGKQMQQAGKAMSAAITAPLLGVAAASLKMSTDFERAMANVSTLVDAPAGAMRTMGEEVLALGRKLPVPIADLTAALYDIRSAGIAAGDAMGVLEGSARLAVAGLGTTKEATDLVTSSLNAFQLKGADAERVYDIIFKTVRAGKTTITQLAQGFGAVAGTVANAGIKLDEYLASIAALTTTGIPAAQAHTMIRAAIAGLTRETETSIRVFQHLGATSFKDLVAKSGGMVQAFTRIRDALGGNDAAMLKLFGSTEALGAVISLAGSQADAFRSALDSMRDGTDAVGVAFDKQNATMAASLQRLQNVLAAAAISIGETMRPAIIRVTEVLQKLVDKFNALEPEMREVIVIAGALAAALGPVLIALGLAVTALSAIGLPAAAVVLAIAGIGVALLKLEPWIDRFDTWLREKLTNALRAVGIEIDLVAMKFRGLGTELAKANNALLAFRQSGDAGFAVATANANTFAGAVGKVGAAVGGLVGGLGKVAPKAQEAFNGARGPLTELEKDTLRVGRTMTNSFENAFVNAVTRANSLRDVLKSLLDDLAKIFAKQAFKMIIGSLFPGGNLLAGTLPGFASGGSFEVGGAGGIDSQTVAFRATPGERVTVDKDGKGGGTMVVNKVNIVNQARGVEVAEQRRDDGELELVVRSIARDEFSSERMNPIMRNKHGLAPRLRAR